MAEGRVLRLLAAEGSARQAGRLAELVPSDVEAKRLAISAFRLATRLRGARQRGPGPR